MLSLQLGVALSSLLTIGGMSSVVVALACQEPLSHLVYGLLLAGSDKVILGEYYLSIKIRSISTYIICEYM